MTKNSRPIRRVLITGGAGFIGSHTADLLVQQGISVVVLDNLSSSTLENLDLSRPEIEFVEGDVLELPLLKDLIMSCDAVLHLAAIASVPASIENPIYTFQVNTQGFLHVLEAVRTANRPIRLVYASSAAVYGNTIELPCNDEIPLTGLPQSPYALQKIHDEDYAELSARLFDIKSLGLRYFNVYGPKQNPDSAYSGVISKFISAYAKKEDLILLGDGHQSRDFIHVADVARANLLALQNDCSGVMNIATGKAETLLNLIQYIESTGGYAAKKRFEAARPGDILSSYGTTRKAQTELEFNAQIKLQDGIKSLLNK